MTNLPRNLRALFRILRFFSLVNLCAVPLLFLMEPLLQNSLGLRPFFRNHAGEIAFTLDPHSFVVARGAAEPNFAEVVRLRGTLEIDNEGAAAGTRRWAIANTVIVNAATSLWFFLLFGYLRDLCARFEVGDVFSEDNAITIRRIGLGLVAYGVFCLLLGIGWQIFFRDNLFGHLQVAGDWSRLLSVNLTLSEVSFGEGTDSCFRDLLLGALVLLLAEAFRQGLKLKTENDLTV